MFYILLCPFFLSISFSEPHLYSMRKVQIDVHLRFQYPEPCCPIHDCKEMFQHRIMLKLLQHRRHYLKTEIKDIFDGVMMMHLDRLTVDRT